MVTATITQLKRDYFAAQLGLTPQQEASMSITDLEEAFFLNPPNLTLSDGLLMPGAVDRTRLEVVSRIDALSNVTFAAGNQIFQYFTPRNNVTLTKLFIRSGSTAAIGATLVRLGIVAVTDPSTGALGGLLAATDNDPTMLSVANTYYEPAITQVAPFAFAPTVGVAGSSINLVKNTRYAFTAVLVGATTAPNLQATALQTAAVGAISPRLNGLISGQTDLGSFTGVPANASYIPWMGGITL